MLPVPISLHSDTGWNQEEMGNGKNQSNFKKEGGVLQES